MNKFTQPSIFEIFEQQKLKSGLRDGIKYLIKVLVEQNLFIPHFLFYNFDEFYLIFETFYEYIHLQTYNSSFSEHFYDLKRISSNTEKLSKKEILSSLFLISVIPYLKNKFHFYYEKHRENQFKDLDQSNKYKKCFLNFNLFFYQKVNFVINLINFICRLTYICDLSKKHDLNLYLSKLVLVHQNVEKSNTYNFKFFLVDVFRFSLTTIGFIIQFLDHWYIEQKSPAFFKSNLVKDPPLKIKTFINLKSCPLCDKKWQNPTMIATTGFVFCFSCINDYVRLNQKCPITSYPININNLVKLN